MRQVSRWLSVRFRHAAAQVARTALWSARAWVKGRAALGRVRTLGAVFPWAKMEPPTVPEIGPARGPYRKMAMSLDRRDSFLFGDGTTLALGVLSLDAKEDAPSYWKVAEDGAAVEAADFGCGVWAFATIDE